MSYALAAKGYNVTSLSADVDSEPTQNLHYLHLDRVYDHIYNSSDKLSDFFAIGQGSSFRQLQLFLDSAILTCEGSVISKGWKHLLDYPNDFKVSA